MNVELWTHCRAATMQPGHPQPYGLIDDAAIAVEAGRIAWIGPHAELPRELLDRTFLTTEEVRSVLGVPCISTVPMLDSDARMRPLVTGIAHLGEVASRPVSRFAESMRNIKVAIDFFPGSRKPQVIGFISAMPGEGKSRAKCGVRTGLVEGLGASIPAERGNATRKSGASGWTECSPRSLGWRNGVQPKPAHCPAASSSSWHSRAR